MRQSCQRRIVPAMAVSRPMLQPVMLPTTSSAKWRPILLSRKSRMPIISSSLSAQVASAIMIEASTQTSALQRSRCGQVVSVRKKP
jgi:hypothetical protein